MSVMEVDQAMVERQVVDEPTGLDALDERLLDQLVGQARERRSQARRRRLIGFGCGRGGEVASPGQLTGLWS
jgi:hypothetical protein